MIFALLVGENILKRNIDRSYFDCFRFSDNLKKKKKILQSWESQQVWNNRASLWNLDSEYKHTKLHAYKVHKHN